MTAAPVRIRIDYFNDIEETEALRLGAFPDGAGELFRVERPSICIGGVAREDVVRLERYDDRYVFLGVFERSSWETHWLLLPREANGLPEAYAEFKQAVVSAGCILEGERVEEEGLRVIISVPAGVPADGWKRAYERMIQRSAGLSPEAFVTRVGDEARQRRSTELERQQREQRASRRRQVRREIAERALRGLAAAACVAAMGWWIHALVTASALTRPRVAALGMIVALSPTVIGSLRDRSFRPPMLGAAAAGVAAWLLAGALSDPAYAVAAIALGVIFALVVGSVAALFGVSSFVASEHDRRIVWLFLVLPCLVSSFAAVLYAVSAARAGHVRLNDAPTIRMAGIVLTLLLVFVPLRRRTLGSIAEVLVPLAIVWLLVWLFGGLQ